MILARKHVVVTGGGRGIGEAVAIAMAAAGARVSIVSRTMAELDEVVARIRTNGGNADAHVADVSDARSVEALFSEVGSLDALVNAAGAYGPIGESWDVDAQKWARAIEVNLIGTFLSCQHAIRAMIRNDKSGKIINFSGGGATAPLPRFSAYAASKAAVVRFTETLAEESRPYGIDVNAIAPGAVDTRLQDEVLAAGEKAGPLLERIRRLRESGEGGVSPSVAAALAVFLASDASNGLSGKLIAAPYDDWRDWDASRIEALMSQPWLTLRRLDEFTIRPLLESLAQSTTA